MVETCSQQIGRVAQVNPAGKLPLRVDQRKRELSIVVDLVLLHVVMQDDRLLTRMLTCTVMVHRLSSPILARASMKYMTDSAMLDKGKLGHYLFYKDIEYMSIFELISVWSFRANCIFST